MIRDSSWIPSLRLNQVEYPASQRQQFGILRVIERIDSAMRAAGHICAMLDPDNGMSACIHGNPLGWPKV